MGNPQFTIKTLRELNFDLIHQIAVLKERFTKLECNVLLIKEQNSQGTDTKNSHNPINLQIPNLSEINSDNTSTKDISSHINMSRLKAKSQSDKVEAITSNLMPEIEHSSTQSESQITFYL
ncbi:hypothetical protein F8M41_021662 [Gigaspora margarita]|uniref:Uncharacterized protein n=1 Tax=Gigaspora margarita TaxID=4874 RepID=A0A8H4AGF5_GIGMA|nr:hypothetical protein F8M41_021662 [Gigaspora margarita]